MILHLFFLHVHVSVRTSQEHRNILIGIFYLAFARLRKSSACSIT